MDRFIRDTRNGRRIGPYTSEDAETMTSALNGYVRRNRLPSDKGPQDPFVVEPAAVTPCHYCGAVDWDIDESSRRTTCCGAL